jgi:hypothetical protein
MRILHVVVYNEAAAHERDMYAILKRVYDLQRRWGVTLFVSLTPDVATPQWDASTNVLRLPGTESEVPGVLDKTVRALHWVLSAGWTFEYVVRSNISTLIHLAPLDAELDESERMDMKVQYAGGHVLMLAWIDPAHGIVNHDLFGTHFASGSCIVLSRERVQKLLHAPLNMALVDDVAIAVALRETPRRFSGRFLFWTTCPSLLDHAWADTALIDIREHTIAQLHEHVRSRGREMIAYRHNAFKADGADDQHENKRDRDVQLMRITAEHVERWLHE